MDNSHIWTILESRRAVRMASRIGTHVSLHSSSVGKAFLASLPVAESEAAIVALAMPALTAHTLTDPAALWADIAAIRVRGYATDLQENELDSFCYGAAILGRATNPIGCISIRLPRYSFRNAGPVPFRGSAPPLQRQHRGSDAVASGGMNKRRAETEV